MNRYWPALLAMALSSPALASDPPDAVTSDDIAHVRDHQRTQELNRREQARVRERDAGYAQGWAAVHAAGDANARNRAYDHQLTNYAHDRARYEQQLAEWRRAVAACQAGDYSACNQ
jgi:hypothetical protein